MVTTHDDLTLISRYGELLGPEYSEEVVRARSTDTDRTLMSAQVSLAGLLFSIGSPKEEE